MPYLEGDNRNQIMLLPHSIEEYVEANNPVRVIDAFVNAIDLATLGFTKAIPASTGRPAYAPADLLKLYIYGYMNKIRSSRKLMIECHRNIEVFFLLRELKPDFRTIADFRKDNPDAIKGVFKEFVKFCARMGLYHKNLIAIDGTKVRAQNAADRVYNKDILNQKLARIDAHIEEYLTAIKENDESNAVDEVVGAQCTKEEVDVALANLHARKSKYEEYLKELARSGRTQILQTDSECHRMHTRNGFHCCYNIQTATDAGSHLICEYEVTDQTNDAGQLTNIALRARDILDISELEVVADKGYDSRSDILNTMMQGILPNIALKYDKIERLYNLNYESVNITDEMKASRKPQDIETCLKAGVLPSCLEGGALSIEVQRPAGVACFTRLDEKRILCPMGKILTRKRIRDGRHSIFASRQACRTCDNRCTSSAAAKEVSFVDGAKYVPVKMYGEQKATNTLPPNAVIHHNSRSLNRKEVPGKVVLRLRCDKEKLHRRMCTVEHPFGSIKWYGDAGYVLCRGKRKVTAEIGLSFLAYNMKRAIKMAGVEALITALGE